MRFFLILVIVFVGSCTISRVNIEPTKKVTEKIIETNGINVMITRPINEAISIGTNVDGKVIIIKIERM